jgi:anti-sigma regulatory factor (Ser/Thr protein kinase)
MTPLDSDHNGSLQIGNTIAEMKKVVDFVDRFCAIHHLPRDIANDVNLCLDEILNNAISYGYDDQDEHSILVTLSVTGNWMIAEIKDDGKPFDPRQSAPPNPLDGLQARRIGGVGLHFVNALMDQVDYVRKQGYNHVQLKKKLQTSD